jgi:hypothetical protein
VSPVKYELGVIPQKTTFFIVTAVNTSNLTLLSVDTILTHGNVSHFPKTSE